MKQLKLVEKYLNLKDLLASTIFMVGIISLNIFVNPGTLAYVGSIVLLAIPLAFLGLAETLVLITGEVDMSVGAGMALANVIPVYAYLYQGIGDYRFILLHLAVGLAIGIINGILVGLIRVNSFLGTLATSTIWTGLALMILHKPEGPIPSWYYGLFMYGFWGIPIVIFGILVFIALWFLFRLNKASIHFYASGSNPRAAFIAGIDVNKIKLLAFVIDGLLVGLAALFITGITASGDPNIGGSYTLSAILAAVMGGAKFTGGTGDGVATLFAAVGLTFTKNLIFSLGIPFYEQDIVNSFIILVLLAIVIYFKGER